MVTFVTEENSFDYISLGGTQLQGHINDVSIAFRGYFPLLPAKRYNHAKVHTKLSKIVKDANKRLGSIIPLTSVIHSQYSLESFPRSLDFNYICRTLDRLLKPEFNSHGESSFLPSMGADRSAVYLALAYHSLQFVRTKGSQFVLASTRTVDAINKVMHALTRVELEHGAAELVQSQKMPSEDSIAGKLLLFLDHWVLWNDTRSIGAVEAVSEQCTGKLKVLDTPRALSNALYYINKIDSFPWMERGEKDAKLNFEQSTDFSQLEFLSPQLGSNAGSVKSEKQHSHSFTPNLTQGSVYLNRSIAASYDPEHSLLNIFIPRLARIPSIFAPTSLIGAKARSVAVKQQVFQSFAAEQIDNSCFKPGVESSALRFQVKINKRTMAWNELSVSVGATETVPIKIQNISKAPGLVRALASVEPLISDYELQLPDERASDREEFAENVDRDSAETFPAALMSLHAQAAAGRMAGLYMKHSQTEAPFLMTKGGREVISSNPGIHERLGINAYVPVSRPFDSSLAVLVQRKLLGPHLPALLYNGGKRPSSESKIEESLQPSLELASVFEKRDAYFQTLQNLQTELQMSSTFHIFRCVSRQAGSPQDHKEGQLVKAFCKDLNIEVDVLSPAHSDQVYRGDQVICTEILELDPLFGLLVVSL